MTGPNNVVTVSLGEVTNSCFVTMPFEGTYRLLYERVIRPAIEAANLNCIRGDEVFTTPQITHEIWKQLRSCRLVVAELSGKNPNVLYELGLAHAIGKPSIIITRSEGDVPFDLRALRYRFYDTGNPYWGEDLKKSITEMAVAVIEQPNDQRIFAGIEHVGNVNVTNVAIVPNPVAQNVAGIWEGSATFSSSRLVYRWNLHLVQHESQLSGTAFISYEKGARMNVVQQTMAGQIEGNKVTLAGTTYTYVQQVTAGKWHLESLQCSLNAGAKELTGTVQGRLSGSIRLKKPGA